MDLDVPADRKLKIKVWQITEKYPGSIPGRVIPKT